MRKIITVIMIIIVIAVILVLAPRVGSRLSPTLPSPLGASPVPTLVPSPTPFLKLDQSSNLTEEAKKLEVLDFSEDYKQLDQSLAGF